MFCVVVLFFFLFKQKTAYEMRISDWSSDVCSSDLGRVAGGIEDAHVGEGDLVVAVGRAVAAPAGKGIIGHGSGSPFQQGHVVVSLRPPSSSRRSEEHTSELQSLMRISYAVFCLKKKRTIKMKKNLTY